MSTLQKRYPGPKSFTQAEEGLFFGRDHDIERLATMVDLKKCLVIYSRSGIGKTSLLNAGLIPYMSKSQGNYVFIPVRFYTFTGETSRTPYQKIIDELKKIEVKPNFLNRLIPTHNSLWYYFKNLQINSNEQNTFLLIFDQFEELFSYNDFHLFEFKKHLADLLFTRIPLDIRQIVDQEMRKEGSSLRDEEMNLLNRQTDVKVLFLIRSDRISYLNQLKDSIPIILDSQHELGSLTGDEAKNAIVNPAGKTDRKYFSKPFQFETEALTRIIGYLTQKKQKIATFELQIICSYIEENLIEREEPDPSEEKATGIVRKTMVIADDLNDIGGIIRNFYDNLISRIESPDERLRARRLIEEQLIQGFRRIPVDESICLKTVRKETLDKLTNEHLLSSEPNSTGGYSYEVSHDTLVTPILHSYNQRKIEEELQERDRKREEDAKKAKEEIEKQQRLRELNIQRRAIIGISLALIVTSLLALFALNQKKQLVISNQSLRDTTTQANNLRGIALIQRDLALKESRRADSLANIARVKSDSAILERNWAGEMAISAKNEAKEAFRQKQQAIRQKAIADSLTMAKENERLFIEQEKEKIDSLNRLILGKQADIDSLIRIAITKAGNSEAVKPLIMAQNVISSISPHDSASAENTFDFSRIISINYPVQGRVDSTRLLTIKEMNYLEKEVPKNKMIPEYKMIRSDLILLYNYIQIEDYRKAEIKFLSIDKTYRTKLYDDQKYLMGYLGFKLNLSEPYKPKFTGEIEYYLRSCFSSLQLYEISYPLLELLTMVQSNFNDLSWGWDMMVRLSDLRSDSFWMNYYIAAFLQINRAQVEYSRIALQHITNAGEQTGQFIRKDKTRMEAWISLVKGYTFYDLAQYDTEASSNGYCLKGIQELEELLRKLPSGDRKNWPDEPSLISKLYDLYDFNSQTLEAEKVLSEGLRKYPDSAPLLSRLFSVYLNRGAADQTLKYARDLNAKYPGNPGFMFQLSLASLLMGDRDTESVIYKFLETNHDYTDYIRMFLYYRLMQMAKSEEARKLLSDRWKTIRTSEWKGRLLSGDTRVWKEMLIGYFSGKVPETDLTGPLTDARTFTSHPFGKFGPLNALRCEGYFYIALKKGADGDKAGFEKYMNASAATNYRPYYEFSMARYLSGIK